MGKPKEKKKLLCDGLTREQITNRLCLWDLAVLMDSMRQGDQDYMWTILTGAGYTQCKGMTDRELVAEYRGRDNLEGILDKNPCIHTYRGRIDLPAWVKKLDVGDAPLPKGRSLRWR